MMYVKSDSILTRAPCGSRLLQRLSFHFPWVPYHFAQTLEITATVGSFVLSSMTQWTWWSTTLSWCWLMLSFSFFLYFCWIFPVVSWLSLVHRVVCTTLRDQHWWTGCNESKWIGRNIEREIGQDGHTISLCSLRGHVVANCLANANEHWITLDKIGALWDVPWISKW